MILSMVLTAVVLFFPVSEITLAIVKRARPGTAEVEDQGSMRLLWASIALGIGLAVVAHSRQWAPLSGPPVFLRLLALALLVGGLGVRWAAILTLGRFFTVDVATQSRQPVIQTGVYRRIRHPSYTGLLLAFVGLGVYFDTWVGLVALMVPITAGVANRIMKEEVVLLARLGPPYAEYRARTKRLIPGLL
ncbi:MAG TPA: isoprenylcysteine carboxylmethyltransferase family protein [Candidatus Polarisedimenticolia bacterium]|nr:isoprenylcysteine carboxylmethyltransferase family protein [Candidatus Polarisedimenticolia bacterium]